MDVSAHVQAKYAALRPYLDERRRRLWAANEALALGRGGVKLVAGVWLDYLHFHCEFELPDPPLDQSCHRLSVTEPEEVRHRHVFVDIGPVNAQSHADPTPCASFLCRGSGQTRKPD